MCVALYLFTDDRIPERPWNKDDPGVSLHAAVEGDDRHAHQWPHAEKNIYYVGGYQGCGCGWDAVNEYDEADDVEAKLRDRLELSRILRSIDLSTSWLVTCWEGDQGGELKPAATITLGQVEDPMFDFEGMQPYRVVPDASTATGAGWYGRLRRWAGRRWGGRTPAVRRPLSMCSWTSWPVLLLLALLGTTSCRSKEDAEPPQLRFTSGAGTIFQDSRGRMWFGSQQEGVAVLDGGAFTYYTADDGLSSNQIRSIQEGPDGTLWFATGHGITSFDGETFTIHTGPRRTGPPIPVGETWHVTPDDLWFLGDSGMHAGEHNGQSVYRYDGHGFESLPLELPTFGDAHNPALVTEIVKTDDGAVWIATYPGVVGFDGRTFTTITEQTPGTGAGLEPLHVRSICVDSRGVLWIGNNGLGVLRYDGGVVTNFTEEQGLSIREKGKIGSLGRIFAIAEDADGAIWFGSRDNGAWRYDGASLTNYTEADGLTSPMVWTIVRDKDDALWFGMADGSVCRFNGESFDEVY